MSFLSKNILLPSHIEYLVVNKKLSILEYSLGVSKFVNSSGQLSIGQDIRAAFPELIGCEEHLTAVFEGTEESFKLTRIPRDWKEFQPIYINIHIGHYQDEANLQDCLLIFIEDVTQSISVEQILVQKNNEKNILLSALKASKSYINKIFASMADALIVTAIDGQIKTINQKASELFGYGEMELVGQAISKIIADRGFLLSEIQQYLLTQGELLQNIEVNCQTKSGEKITVSFSCSVIVADIEELHDFIYIGRDITKHRRAQQQQAVQYYVTKIISEYADLFQAAPKILQGICEYLEWDAGELWMVEGSENEKESLMKNLRIERSHVDNAVLRLVKSWQRKSMAIAESSFENREKTLAIGEGLPGRVWGNCAPEYVSELTNEVVFSSKQIGLQAGFNGACGFPIQSDGEVLGVILLLGCEVMKLDEDLFPVMTTIGSQLGQFVKRKKAEEALIRQQEKTENLLLNILPEPIAEQLKKQATTIANSFDEVTVLFADLVDFTSFSSSLSPIEVVEMLNMIFSEFDRLSEKHGLEKIKTIGDAYMVVGGLPKPRADHAEAIAEMALDIKQAIAKFNANINRQFRIRIGIHTGPVVAGVIGTKKFIYDLWGDTVNTASRMESHGIPDKIQVTGATYDRLKDFYAFEKRGSIYVKGKGKMIAYFLIGKKEL